MASYVVMLPPGRVGAVDGAKLTRDGFHFLAFLLPPLWLLWHRLWIEALLALAASLALTALGEIAGLGPVSVALSLLVALYVGLEGAALRVNALRRRGWLEWGVVDAAGIAEAEIRFLAEQEDPRIAESPRAMAPPSPMLSRRAASGPALGLFDYPGRP